VFTPVLTKHSNQSVSLAVSSATRTLTSLRGLILPCRPVFRMLSFHVAVYAHPIVLKKSASFAATRTGRRLRVKVTAICGWQLTFDGKVRML
jgi:hypothetical protein